MKQPTAPFAEAIIAPPVRTSSMLTGTSLLNMEIVPMKKPHNEPPPPYHQYFIPPHELMAQNSFPSTSTVFTDVSSPQILSRTNTLELHFDEAPKRQVVKTETQIIKPKWYKSLLCWGLPTYMKIHAATLEVPADEFHKYNKLTFNELSALANAKVVVKKYFYNPDSLDMPDDEEYKK